MAIVVVGNKKETSPNMLVISRARVVIRLKIKAAGKEASRKERCKAYAWVGLDQTSRQKNDHIDHSYVGTPDSNQ